MPVVLLFSLSHQPVAHLLVGFTRQGAGGVVVLYPASDAGPGLALAAHDGAGSFLRRFFPSMGGGALFPAATDHGGHGQAVSDRVPSNNRRQPDAP